MHTNIWKILTNLPHRLSRTCSCVSLNPLISIRLVFVLALHLSPVENRLVPDAENDLSSTLEVRSAYGILALVLGKRHLHGDRLEMGGAWHLEDRKGRKWVGDRVAMVC